MLSEEALIKVYFFTIGKAFLMSMVALHLLQDETLSSFLLMQAAIPTTAEVNDDVCKYP